MSTGTITKGRHADGAINMLMLTMTCHLKILCNCIADSPLTLKATQDQTEAAAMYWRRVRLRFGRPFLMPSVCWKDESLSSQHTISP
ncbi:hypothetical protein CEXT_487621 [Caerostris extrusa]|uniref:Uncharacterized protein n=1 Tax=Caerostris extrusa TaxID=172846 RepID=A0AAV4Q5W7_CAEEX|nr:hypothetical protein CEXT_487621 [Caerostris extrusa]